MTTIALPAGENELLIGPHRLRAIAGPAGATVVVDVSPRDVHDPQSADAITITITGPQVALSGT